ncbi:VCBS repeat-containing protein [Mycolicibacterium sp. BK556]|uniref:Ig-like domain-containing protein n=1 Tax=unclassified Mycolicibacterium TaxID=2636767 RepID=UPI0016213AAA|nr:MULTISPECIES: VCBS domain-containing protein [unclassified Mycolicibacterium]MBB3603977.1 VCBS repeat-containing protein [Mycolicibacterium sp. BK556]MBB3634172.1 VCBS repeat-containing protein [Mycolicibacterium sp. BK607]
MSPPVSTAGLTPTAAAAANPLAGFLRAVVSLLGVDRPTPPSNPIAALVWGLLQQVAAAVGVAPKAGTPTVISPVPSTGLVTGTLGFTNPGGGTLTYSVTTEPALGDVTVDEDGNYRYTPTLNARLGSGEGTGPVTDTFTVTAYNGIGSAHQWVTVPISPLMDNPVGDAPHVGTPNGVGVVTGHVVFTDPGGRPLTYSVAANPTNGAITHFDTNTGEFTYTPGTLAQWAAEAAGKVGADTFVVTATNGVASSSVTVTVPVSPGTPEVGTAVVNNPSATGVVTGKATFTDPSGGTLVYSVSVNPAKGTITNFNSGTGAFTYTPSASAQRAAEAAGKVDADTFVVTASNGVATNSVTVTVVVDPGTPQTGTPVVNASSDNRTVAGRAMFTDPAGGTLIYSVTSNPSMGTITKFNSYTGEFTYVPNANPAETGDVFVVTASNGVHTATQTVSVPTSADPLTGTWNITHSSDPNGWLGTGPITFTQSGSQYTAQIFNAAILTATGPNTYAGSATDSTLSRWKRLLQSELDGQYGSNATVLDYSINWTATVSADGQTLSLVLVTTQKYQIYYPYGNDTYGSPVTYTYTPSHTETYTATKVPPVVTV